MSNVLIGIIGIILFIGLALAGALFLGEDFMSATTSSRSSPVASHMQQVSNAINTHNLKTGTVLSSLAYNSNGYGANLVPRFLKTLPRNPINGQQYYAVNGSGSTDRTPIRYIYTDIGGGEEARRLCRAVAEAAGWPDPDLSTTYNFVQSVTAFPRMGCARINDAEYDVYIAV